MKLTKILLAAVMILTIPVSASALDIVFNSEAVDSEIPPFAENNTTYMSVRDMGSMLGADSIEWNGVDSSVTVGFDGHTLKLFVGSNFAYMDGGETWLSSAMLARNGRTYLPVRAVSELLGAEVLWDSKTETVYITLNQEEDADDLLWLARIVHVEAGNESYEGKLAVANVILNRVKSTKFPNTIYDVIFQAKQFPPAANGELDDLTPNEGSVQAAKAALGGANNVGESLYFCAASQIETSWVANNCTFYTQIGNHCFYY